MSIAPSRRRNSGEKNTLQDSRVSAKLRVHHAAGMRNSHASRGTRRVRATSTAATSVVTAIIAAAGQAMWLQASVPSRRIASQVEMRITRSLVPVTVLHDAPQRPDAVPPSDLLPLLVRPARVGDADLEDPALQARELGGDLRLEAEPVLADGDLLQDLAAEHLVAGLHVREVEVGEHVGEQREEAVPHRVP